jgi:hypothetical protein
MEFAPRKLRAGHGPGAFDPAIWHFLSPVAAQQPALFLYKYRRPWGGDSRPWGGDSRLWGGDNRLWGGDKQPWGGERPPWGPL